MILPPLVFPGVLYTTLLVGNFKIYRKWTATSFDDDDKQNYTISLIVICFICFQRERKICPFRKGKDWSNNIHCLWSLTWQSFFCENICGCAYHDINRGIGSICVVSSNLLRLSNIFTKQIYKCTFNSNFWPFSKLEGRNLLLLGCSSSREYCSNSRKLA